MKFIKIWQILLISYTSVLQSPPLATMEEGRPAQPRFLDLSALRPQTQEEVSSALHRLPELRLRPDRPDEEGTAVGTAADQSFPDPVPAAMRRADLRMLSKVDIPWKMLTLERPDSHVEMNIFTRIVYLNKLTLRCMVEEQKRREREKALALRRPGKGAGDPSSTHPQSDIRPEEFSYDFFSRLHGAGAGDRGAVEEAPRPPPPPAPAPPPPKEEVEPEATPPAEEKKKKKLKGKRKKRKVVVKKKSSKTGSKTKTKKKMRRKKCGKKKRELGPGKTLVQMLKWKKTSKHNNNPKSKEPQQETILEKSEEIDTK